MSGPELLQRGEGKCEDFGRNMRHPPGLLERDQADCWRPTYRLSRDSIERLSCNRPVCTLADIFSCSVPDCVQLTDPEEQVPLDLNELIGISFVLVGVWTVVFILIVELRMVRIWVAVRSQILCASVTSFILVMQWYIYSEIAIQVLSDAILEGIMSQMNFGQIFIYLMMAAGSTCIFVFSRIVLFPLIICDCR